MAGARAADVHGEEGNREERVVEKNGEQVSALALHYTDVREEAEARV